MKFYIPLSTKTLLILLMLAFFFAKNIVLFGKNGTFTQSNSVKAVLDIF